MDAYDFGAPVPADDQTFTFGVSAQHTALALEHLAARVRDGSILAQNVTLRTTAKPDDFVVSRLLITFHERKQR